MTGLAPADDLILEVAAIVTDWNFKELATYEGIVKNKPLLMKQRFATNMPFWEEHDDIMQQLIGQNKNGKTLMVIEDELLAFLDKNFKASELVLPAGNSIHIDRRFIINKWPRFDARLNYRMLDVSAWKVVFAGKFKKKFTKAGVHRAIDDIRGSIMELQYYLTKVKK